MNTVAPLRPSSARTYRLRAGAVCRTGTLHWQRHPAIRAASACVAALCELGSNRARNHRSAPSSNHACRPPGCRRASACRQSRNSVSSSGVGAGGRCMASVDQRCRRGVHLPGASFVVAADIAETARVYAKRAQLGQEAIRHATEIKLRAERKAGEILAATPKNEGRAGAGRPPLGSTEQEPPKDSTPTLADLGVTKKESSRYQKLAALPAPVWFFVIG